MCWATTEYGAHVVVNWLDLKQAGFPTRTIRPAWPSRKDFAGFWRRTGIPSSTKKQALSVCCQMMVSKEGMGQAMLRVRLSNNGDPATRSKQK